jgi:hypothetical protein
LQSVVTHNNAAGLEDLVIIDQLWLLRQETAIVRPPSLHPLPCDSCWRLFFMRGFTKRAF